MSAEGSPLHVTWEHVLAWRMERHSLLRRAPTSDVTRLASRLCGLHAQLRSSAELSLWARVEGLGPGALDRALWERRMLVKTWAMRGTLHLLPSAELGLWFAALGTHTGYGNRWAAMDVLAEVVAESLAGRLLTREELAQAVEQQTGSRQFGEWIRSSWGSYLKALAFRGIVCFAPSAGGRVRFTTPKSWLGHESDPWEPMEALTEVTRRYLATYAPATVEDLARWWGVGPARARRMLASLGDEVVQVWLDRTPCWVLRPDLEQLARATSPGVVRLLPAFDPWVANGSRNEPEALDPRYKKRVFRSQGWISPVVLVDGRIAGVWAPACRGRLLQVQIELFEELPVWAREQLQAEAERLARYVECRLDLRTARLGHS
jgi:uncharacterized protein YcaQ